MTGKRINIVSIILLHFCFLLSTILFGQVIKDDFLVNNPDENLSGIGRTSIAVSSNSNFAVAWHDYNDYNVPVAEQPRISAQLFSSNANAIGPLNLFRGESRGTLIWTGDYLEENFDIAFTPDGILLIVVEHQGEESFANISSQTSEIGLGAINSLGQIIDLGNHTGVIDWLNDSETELQNNPRITVTQSGEFIVTFDGLSAETNFRKVQIQVFNSDGSSNDIPFTSHIDNSSVQANHRNSDVATNGNLSVAVWQDGRFDGNWDISAQYYSSTEVVGNNIKVNQKDAQGTLNAYPSVSINSSGESVVAWIDTRNSNNGDIYCQRFNSSAQPIGDNVRVSNGSGVIVDRPEVSILEDGYFIIVWTDSISSIGGDNGYRAKGRQFNSDGIPLNEAFIIPNQNVISGFTNIATDGIYYFCSWLDNRLEKDYLNVYAKVFDEVITSINNNNVNIPQEYKLEQNYPNPFNPTTTINYFIPYKQGIINENKNVTLKIYNILGKEVTTLVNQNQKPGNYSIKFNASEFTSRVVV